MFDQRRAVYRRRPWLSQGVRLGKKYGAYVLTGGLAYGASQFKPNREGARDITGYPIGEPVYSRRGMQRRKRVKTKSNGKLSSDVKSIKDQLSSLKQSEDSNTGLMTYRQNVCTVMGSAINEQTATEFHLNDISTIETVLAQTKYFNPAVPGTLTTGSSVAGTFQRNVLISGSTIKVKLANNYQTLCHLDIYLCSVKDDTSQSVITAWQAGIPDGSNLTDELDLNQYPTDYNTVNDLYRLKKIKTVSLQPGQQCNVSHSVGSFEYDPSLTDTHNLEYQKEYKACTILVIGKGALCHDSVTLSQNGINKMAVDIEVKQVYKVKYSAGINIKYTYVTNTYDTPTNGFVCSNKPVSGQQAYSV